MKIFYIGGYNQEKPILWKICSNKCFSIYTIYYIILYTQINQVLLYLHRNLLTFRTFYELQGNVSVSYFEIYESSSDRVIA